MFNSDHKWQFPTLSVLILALLLTPLAHSQYTIDFETG
jgi:hypothetical protein